MKQQMNSFIASFKGEKYDHLWGYELWIENNELYCNKLLILNKGFSSSWHYHKMKDETFIILQGTVELEYAREEFDEAEKKIIVLGIGDKFRIKPYLIHKFKSLSKQSIVMEVSLTDDDDNIKLESAHKLESE